MFETAHQETSVHVETGVEEQTPLDKAISLGVILVILVTVIMVWRLNNKFGGKLKSALMLFISGVLVNFFAALWGSFISHRVYALGSSFDIHNFFMALATVLFLLSIMKFATLIPRTA